MTSLNLLDINVDSLFEQYNITEIDQVHKKLETSIEEKKEELRIMVGERYRDLLQAADTIGDMKKTSAVVIEHIDGIISSCRHLNEQQLLGFILSTTESIAASNADSKLHPSMNNYYSCIGQIHLLTALPELIWTRLDDDDYFIATQLFIFARHISTGLQLDANMNIMKKFPVAKRQWNHLNQFFFMIKQRCLEQLEKPELSTITAVKCLASLLLLENCQLDKLLSMFIQLRTRAFRQILIVDDVCAQQRAKDRILASLQMLNETILLLFKCFIDVVEGDQQFNKSYLMKELEHITGSNAKPTISLIKFDNSVISETLPPLIAKFRPQIQIKPIEANAVKRALDTWIKATEDDARQCLKSVIDNIGSIRTIHNINQAVLELEKPPNWSTILKKLQLTTNIDFYQMFYQPLIHDRIKSIVKSSWSTTVLTTENELSKLLDADDNNWSVQKSFWCEENADNPLSLKQALNANRESHRLLMKTKGFTSDICGVCSNLDKSVELIYNDLDLYINGMTTETVHKRDNDLNAMKLEQEKIVEFLRICSQDGVMELISNIKSLANKKNNQKHLIFLARLLKAISEICPHVKQCLMPTTLVLANTWNDKNPSSVEQWERVCRLLNDETLNLWKQWINLFINECLSENHGVCFNINIQLINLLRIFPNWETISIEEKDESNQSVESTIRVPSQPSISLQQFLFGCCKQLNTSIPNTLPKQVTTLLMDQLIDRLVFTYNELNAKNTFVSTNQNASLQFYFDLKFIAIMFLSGRRHEELHAITLKFKSNIDPFDFELFHKYVNGNVKLAAQRMQHQYGTLIPSAQQLSTILATMSKQGNAGAVTTQEKDPNVMPLCASGTHTNWFTLLPIVVPTKNVTSIDATQAAPIKQIGTTKNEKKKSPVKISTAQPTTQSSTQQNLANVKSNAAAFFGAMSQDWFR